MNLFKNFRRHHLYVLVSVLVLILILVLTVGRWYKTKIFKSAPPLETLSQSEQDSLKSAFNPETKNTAEAPTVTSLPSEFLIADVPFQTQAPLTNWDTLHEEACEEASIILAAFYLKGQSLSAETIGWRATPTAEISPEIMEQEILKLVGWEDKNWGGPVDITADEAGQLAQKVYNLKYKVINDATITDIEKEIAAGRPVIVPAAGRLLGNPNFRGEGPVYHMVVAIGYNSQNMIVQDVGTRNGNHYVYNQKIFYNAMHDWTGNPDTIVEGAKNVLVLTLR